MASRLSPGLVWQLAGLPGSPRGLIYSETDYHQTALESDLSPQTPNGNGSSGHFKEQGLLAFLVELKMYGIMKMHSNAQR